jgi:hypothetical protein
MAKVSDVVPAGVKGLKLELNLEELQFLCDVINNIGGCPDKSRRRISASIRDTLRAAGVDTEPRNPADLRGNIYFHDKSEAKSIKDKPQIWDDEVPF